MPPKKTQTSSGEGAEATPPFEQALGRLETIVEELESGQLTLEESIARYEEGMRLSRGLAQTLDEAEKRIEKLVESRGDAAPTTRPMDEDFEPGAGGAGELPF